MYVKDGKYYNLINNLVCCSTSWLSPKLFTGKDNKPYMLLRIGSMYNLSSRAHTKQPLFTSRFFPSPICNEKGLKGITFCALRRIVLIEEH